MDCEAMIRQAYGRLDRWDIDGLLEIFGPNAKFFVPGRTRISGDHPREAIAAVLENMRALASEGMRTKILGVVPCSSGALATLHQYVVRDGQEYDYHSIHDWDIREGMVAYWWIYVHEYDAFERAWS
jgi:ketosteroid isomerase-like protein